MYKQNSELTSSPYFNHVSNFTQDLDRLYRDIVTNDIITNVNKYSSICWNFIKVKYFEYVPFGREMNEVISEVTGELRKLYQLEPVQFVNNKLKELQRSLEWVANEFQVEKRIHQLWAIVQYKISHIAQTALQIDDQYREAKTKFVFDPDTGVVELEQKLPMSWHAFNETPIFEEIPEYKILLDIQNFFVTRNLSHWALYRMIWPCLDTATWLPPHKCMFFCV